ncbi:phage tail family protein [Desulfosporosinus sp.]|uniref:phage tail family protein n=1 Tax=Desulfosporosinus sp. TaxID=157907 RepID=UPI0025BBCAC9|nr:phage tail family protein [Desulfosporosinus sp.]MBC2722346.1 phage tail family protein [Desulfosporosinus sp.]MBC2728620.1 phage tail family protein [Desulfosporosinus sp.]
MPKVTYTNERGQSVMLGDSAPLLVTRFDGIGSVYNEILRQKAPYQDGSTVTGGTLAERELTIEGSILAPDKDTYRRQLLQAFNPKLGGTLRYEKGSVVKEIECITELAPAFPSNFSVNHQVFLITLLCPKPFWLDIETETDEIVTWIGGMSFPLRLPTIYATKGPKLINIINQGDVETPARIEFKGPATNPRITNQTTGEYIQVNRSLLNTDKLIITTDFGAKRVEIEDESGSRINAFNWIDLGSTFWSLQVGDNVVEYSSDDQVEPAAVFVSYRNRYIGI